MRYSKSEVRGIVNQLEVEAKLAGLLPMDHKLSYSAGNTSNGISAQIFTVNAEGQHVLRPLFVPEFGYKTGPTEQAKLLGAALDVFFALRLQREEADRIKRRELSEHVARRSGR